MLPFVPVLPFLGQRWRAGLIQRLGLYPKGIRGLSRECRPLWIHAASVGEVRSTEPLINELKSRMPQRKILLSTFTAAGNRVAKQIAAADAVIFLPLDLLWVLRWTLSRINPAALIVIETEIWPNLLREAYRRGMPTLLLSGRLSAKSLGRYLPFRFFFRHVLGYFTVMGMQSREDAERILQLGADEKRVSVAGSLKFAASRPSRGQEARQISSIDSIHDKLWLVAASTHRGEEEILLKVYETLQSGHPRLSMILAPRHPERFDEVEKLLKAGRFSFHRRSRVEKDNLFAKQILLLDSVGELVDFFPIGDIVFVGGSMVDRGGHNLLEPAGSEKAILFGPYMANFRKIADEFLRAGAAIEVRDAEMLSSVLAELLGDSARRRRMGELAGQIARGQNESLSNSMHLAARYI